MATRMGYALSLAAAITLVFASLGAQADSHVRIVRLSYVDGQVQMDRATGQGVERAILNAPVVEGTRLVTGNSGLAEVEFEDQSTLRLADNSEVAFRQLLMNDAGNKVNEIEVVRGVVYFDAKKGTDTDRLLVNGTSFRIERNTEMRLTADPDGLKLAVFKGNVVLENQAQPVGVKRKETLALSTASPSSPVVAPGVDSVSYDAWNNEREAYSSTYARTAEFGGPSVNNYGAQDLNYYGNYFYASGYGYAWQPYGISGWTGWNPYMVGAWTFNPAFGYSFASGYPWGWLPYHYGSWAYLPNAGWAWLPGSTSTYKGAAVATNFKPVPMIMKAPAGFTPATPPLTTAVRNPTVSVGRLGSMPAYIPGGRIPPDFRSVLAPALSTRPAGTVFSTATPASRAGFGSFSSNGEPTSRLSARSPSGHVFAAPSRSLEIPSSWAAAYGGFGNSSTSSSTPGMAGAHGGTTSAGSMAGHSGPGANAHH